MNTTSLRVSFTCPCCTNKGYFGIYIKSFADVAHSTTDCGHCKAVADHYEYACNAELDGAGPYTQKDVAKDEGWDCFPQEDGK